MTFSTQPRYVGVTGSIDVVTKRFIFTIKIESYNNIEEVNSDVKPWKIIEYTGIYGKIFLTDYKIRLFGLFSSYGSLQSYNKNNEYEKITFKNNLKIEEKQGTKEGEKITRYKYDSYSRLIREYEIFEGKKIEQNHYEYDDTSRVIFHKSFHDGELFSCSKVELEKGNEEFINENDRSSIHTKNWIRKTSYGSDNELSDIEYYTKGNKIKWEYYGDNGKLYSTTKYDPSTGEEIENIIEEEFKEEDKKKR